MQTYAQTYYKSLTSKVSLRYRSFCHYPYKEKNVYDGGGNEEGRGKEEGMLFDLVKKVF